MNKRRWTLLGFNLLLAAAIVAQPAWARSACDFDVCTCACLVDWDACEEAGGESCDAKFNKCYDKCEGGRVLW